MQDRLLECFLLVAQLRNFSKAANELFISQSAVTQQIKRLERKLGVQLFYRNNKAVSLTKAGESFYEDAAEIMRLSTVAIKRAQDLHSGHKRLLTINYISSENEVIIPCILSKFRANFPDIQVNLTKGSLESIKDNLLTGKVDASFITDQFHDFIDNEDYQKTFLFKDKEHCLMRADHRLAEKESISLQDLKGETLLLINTKMGSIDKLRTRIMRDVPEINVVGVVPGEIPLTMVRIGLGVSIRPLLACPQDNGLKAVPLDVGSRLSVYLVTRKKPSTILQAFLKEAEEACEEFSW